MNAVNQKIIDAIIEKAGRDCPDSVALIGIYGSAATGDTHEKSDLDLLILIRDENGRQLSSGFILEDSKVGYDIYCTTWEALLEDAKCHHAQLAKLMDSRIVYIKSHEDYDSLCALREQTKAFLQSDERFACVKDLLLHAKAACAEAYLYEELSKIRMSAFEVINCLVNALMLFHGTYFRRGVKRMLEELSVLPVEEAFLQNIKQIAASKDVQEIRNLLKNMILYAQGHVRTDAPKELPSANNLTGVYEEMFSNWRNKTAEAAKNNDVFSSFMNLCSLQSMYDAVSVTTDIGAFDIIKAYNPEDLAANVKTFDASLSQLEEIYKNAGLRVSRFADADAFAAAYLK